MPFRFGSRRLPGKAMADIEGRSSVEWIVRRMQAAPGLDGICVATSDLPEDEPVRQAARAAGAEVFAGSLDDVLGRILGAARSVGADTIVYVNGDSPLVDPRVVQTALDAYLAQRPDYASTYHGGGTYPDGYSVEVFSTALLAEVEAATQDPDDREHVTIYIYEGPRDYDVLALHPDNLEFPPGLHLCLDTAEDLELMREIYRALGPERPFSMEEVVELVTSRPELQIIDSV